MIPLAEKLPITKINVIALYFLNCFFNCAICDRNLDWLLSTPKTATYRIVQNFPWTFLVLFICAVSSLRIGLG